MPAAVFDRRSDPHGREIRRTFPGKRKKHAPPPNLHEADSQRYSKKSGARPRKRRPRLKLAPRSETSRRLAHTVPSETTGIGSASRPYQCNKSASEFRSSRNPHSRMPITPITTVTGESAASGWSSSLVTAATAPTGSDCGNSSRPSSGCSVTPEIEAGTDFGPASAATGSCFGAA